MLTELVEKCTVKEQCHSVPALRVFFQEEMEVTQTNKNGALVARNIVQLLLQLLYCLLQTI